MGLAEAVTEIKKWRRDPVYFVKSQFKVEPDAWQKEALDAFGSNDPKMRRISLQACAGPGKSTVLAWCIWHFLACRGSKGQHPKGAVVAITSDNLKDNLWPELSKWQSRSPFLMGAFSWTKERIFAKDHPPTWFVSARSWSKNADPEEQGRTLSGLHSEYVLAVIDESGDIPISVLKAGEQALSNCKWGKILQAGNPTSMTGMLYAAATNLRDQWHIIRITGDPDDPNRSPRINIDDAREQIAKWGREDPWVMAYILGKFPPASWNQLLGPEEVQAAMSRTLKDEDYQWSQKRLGVDVARFGDDRTIIFPRQGLVAFKPAEMRNARGNDIAARLAQAKAKWGSEMEFVDDTGGYGATVIDSCLQAGMSPIPVNFSSKAIDPRYFNKRSEMWFALQAWIKRGGVLPNRPGLLKELTAPTYTFKNGKFQLEEKEQIKARLKFSPDEADALALTFAIPDAPSASSPMGMGQKVGKMESDYDPYDPSRL